MIRDMTSDICFEKRMGLALCTVSALLSWNRKGKKKWLPQSWSNTFLPTTYSSLLPSHKIFPKVQFSGPLLFILYMLPLGHIILHHGLHFHCFVNDIQLHIVTKPSLLLLTLSSPNASFNWNPGFKPTSSNLTVTNQKSSSLFPNSSSNSPITSPSPSMAPHAPYLHICNLGVTFDQTLSFHQHIKHQTSPEQPVSISETLPASIHPSPFAPAAENLIKAFTTFRLVHCNGLITAHHPEHQETTIYPRICCSSSNTLLQPWPHHPHSS